MEIFVSTDRRVVQKRTGQIIGSPEKVAYREGLVTKPQLNELAEPLRKSGYGEYLLAIED